jgi:dipeptidyl aminopeptidase/acylaminoacyl peptidase
MIEQGANDMSTPATNEVAAELKKRRSDFQYLVYPDEGHYLVKTKDKIDFEIKRVEFFVEHLHP